MDRRLTTGAVVLTCLAATWRHVQAACNPPPAVAGTRHNGTLDVYQSGDVLSFSCDTGYNPNYNPPTSTCLDSGAWNPSEVACELDVVSLVVAIVVALVGVIVFVLAILWLRKRRTETDSRKIRKKRASSNKYANYEPRRSTRNGYDNHGMTDIEMNDMGTPMRGNGSMVSRDGTNGHANGLIWSPPNARGTVTQDEEFAVLQRSRKSSATSRSSRTDNMSPNMASGVQLNPDVGDVEFGAQNTNMHNFKSIGSTMQSMAAPKMVANSMDMSLPMPDSISPRSSDENDGNAEPPKDFDNLYASVDMSKKSSKKKNSDKESNNNNSNKNDSVTVEATIESDGYSAIGSSSSFSAHEEALAEDSQYSDIKFDADGDYAEVKRVDEQPKDVPEKEDFGSLYASVKK